MSFAHRGPSLYRRAGHPFDGVPLPLADATFNSQFVYSGVGNGTFYTGPQAHATAPSANTVSDTGGGWKMSSTSSSTTGGTAIPNNAGELVLTSGTTAEDLTQLQGIGSVIRWSATNKIWCFARVATSTAITTDAVFGLTIADTTVLAASAEGVSDSFHFFKAATATDWTFQVQKNGTTTSTTLGLTLTDAAYAVIGFTSIAGVIRVYGVLDPNDVVRTNSALLGAGAAVVATNAVNDEDLLLTLAVGQEGGTTARTLTADWAFACATHV